MTQAERLRVVMLPWMVAGVRTQYENLHMHPPPTDCDIDTIPIDPYKAGGLIEALPLLQATQKGTLRSTLQTLPLLGRPAYDAVWAQTLLPLLPLMMAGRLGIRRQPAVIYTIDTTPALMDTVHTLYYRSPPAGPRKRRLRDRLYRKALRRCVAVTPWSRWAARSFVQDYGVPEARIHILPPGVDLTAWAPAPRGDAQAERSEPFRLLFVGADFARKGGPLLLDLFRTHLRASCELHMVTRAAIPTEPGLHLYTQFSPNEPGLRALYRRCDALILPTHADCFSLAALEAMASGLPVVSCPVGGIPEIVRHGETGLLVPPGDGRALLEAIRTLIADPHLAQGMGRAGRRLAEECFDNSKASAALWQLIRECGLQARGG